MNHKIDEILGEFSLNKKILIAFLISVIGMGFLEQLRGSILVIPFIVTEIWLCNYIFDNLANSKIIPKGNGDD